ncbi:HAD family hydrolase [Ampullimonas aquatilis]|uniref:HAD family hydrolase n=1 Tax=Ampullimonas aquatilis TaxID=1341549 RepID=UPI003C77B74E
MSEYSVVSFDVWDTLLRRHCHPDAIKARVAQIFLLSYRQFILPQFQDVFQLLKARQQVEHDIGVQSKNAGHDFEYAIAEVLQGWIQKVCIEEPANLPELVEAFIRVEIEQERAMIYADPHIEKILEQHSAAKKIFISDFYLSADHLHGLLEQVGLRHYFDHGYSSSDHRLSKASGRLFDHVVANTQLDKQSLKHYGDNPHADVKMPTKVGIANERFLPESEHQARLTREQIFTSRNLAIQQLRSVGLQALESHSGPDEIKRLVAETGLLFIGFALYIQQQIVEQGQEAVFFFTREGEFFRQIYEVLRQHDVLGAPVPPAGLLEVSRVATFGPSLREISTHELMRLWSQYSSQNMASLFKSLNVMAADYQIYLDKHQVPLDEVMHHPWKDQRVQALFADMHFTAVLGAQLQSDQTMLRNYLIERGLTDDLKKVAIVDIGWRGTIQDNISYLYPQTELTGYYLGLHEMINVQPGNVKKQAFGPDLNKNQATQYSEVMHFAAPLEMLTNSPNGSTTGYHEINGKMMAIRLVDDDENQSYEAFTRHYQEMLLAATPAMAEVIKRNVIQLSEIQPVAWSIWYNIVTNPPKIMADAFFKLNHNETFGMGEFVSKDLSLHPLWFIKIFVNGSYRHQFKQFLTQISWIYGYAKLYNKPGLVMLRRCYQGLADLKQFIKPNKPA